MEESLNDTVLREANQLQAKYIAIVVRNAMEEFHSKYLSDEQMKELNPIIRNAIYTALYTINNHRKSENVKAFIKQQFAMIPAYWEDPELLDGFKE